MLFLNDLLPPGYDIRHVDRERRGGGVALIYKKDISFRNIVPTHENYSNLKLLDCIIKVKQTFYKTSCGVQTPRHHVKNGLKYEKLCHRMGHHI